MKKKVISLMLASAMVLSMTACGGDDGASNDSSSPASESGSSEESASEDSSEPSVETDNSNWDGAYIDADDYRAYISHDLDQLVIDIQDQLTAEQKTAVEAARTAGAEAIAAAGTIADVQKAYDDAYNAILAAVPVADGLISYSSATNDEMTDMLGIVETYAVRNGITGISLFEDGNYQMYNPRVTLGTENYIVGYGFGTLAEGSITEDLEYESNPDWKRYYHALNAADPGTLNVTNEQGSEVSDLYSYIRSNFYNNFMNETKDGYDWVPELAMEKPVAVNDDNGDGAATKIGRAHV